MLLLEIMKYYFRMKCGECCLLITGGRNFEGIQQTDWGRQENSNITKQCERIAQGKFCIRIAVSCWYTLLCIFIWFFILPTNLLALKSLQLNGCACSFQVLEEHNLSCTDLLHVNTDGVVLTKQSKSSFEDLCLDVNYYDEIRTPACYSIFSAIVLKQP